MLLNDSVMSPAVQLSVVPRIPRRAVTGLVLGCAPGTVVTLDRTPAIGFAPAWTSFDTVPITAAAQWYFDLSGPLSSAQYFRACTPTTRARPQPCPFLWFRA